MTSSTETNNQSAQEPVQQSGRKPSPHPHRTQNSSPTSNPESSSVEPTANSSAVPESTTSSPSPSPSEHASTSEPGPAASSPASPVLSGPVPATPEWSPPCADEPVLKKCFNARKKRPLPVFAAWDPSEFPSSVVLLQETVAENGRLLTAAMKEWSPALHEVRVRAEVASDELNEMHTVALRELGIEPPPAGLHPVDAEIVEEPEEPVENTNELTQVGPFTVVVRNDVPSDTIVFVPDVDPQTLLRIDKGALYQVVDPRTAAVIKMRPDASTSGIESLHQALEDAAARMPGTAAIEAQKRAFVLGPEWRDRFTATLGQADAVTGETPGDVRCTRAVSCPATGAHEPGCLAKTHQDITDGLERVGLLDGQTRELVELRGLQLKFWMCPNPEHRTSTELVDWDGDVAKCMVDGCSETSQPPTVPIAKDQLPTDDPEAVEGSGDDGAE